MLIIFTQQDLTFELVADADTANFDLNVGNTREIEFFKIKKQAKFESFGLFYILLSRCLNP